MAEENKWKEAELRRDDIKKLLENTKQLAEMYSEIIGIKKTEAKTTLSLILFNLQMPIAKNRYNQSPHGATSSSAISPIRAPSRNCGWVSFPYLSCS